MTRIETPLSHAAVSTADDAFYARHPEMVKNGKREPLSGTDPSQEGLREEWRVLYKDGGGSTAPPAKTATQQAVADVAKADAKAKSDFPAAPAAKATLPCANDASPASDPPPTAKTTQACVRNASCKAIKVSIHSSKARGGVLGPRNELQVVPDDEFAAETIVLDANVATCGKVVTWTVSGATEETATQNVHALTVRGWPYRPLVGLSPLSRWAARAIPNTYRIRASLPCGTLAETFMVSAYPSDQIKHTMSPEGMPFLSAFQEYVVDGFLTRIFGDKLEIEFLRGSLSLEASWQEDDASWRAYYAYDIALGFDPLLGVTAKISVLSALGAMVSIPQPAVSWLERYVGKALYLSAGGRISLDGHLERTGIETFAHWSVLLEGALELEAGLEVKLGNEKLLKATVKGTSGLTLSARIGPKEEADDPRVLLDAKFDGLKANVEVEVASGWYTFNEEYELIGEKILLSNHEASIFSEVS